MSHMSPPDENRRRLVTWLGVLLLIVSFSLFLAALTRNLVVVSREGRDVIAELLTRAGIYVATPSGETTGAGDAASGLTPTAITVLLPTSEVSRSTTATITVPAPLQKEVAGTEAPEVATSPTPWPVTPTIAVATEAPTTAPPTVAPPTVAPPTNTPSASPSATQSPLPPTATPTVAPPTVAPTWTASATATATAQPTVTATSTPTPTLQPTEGPTPRPTLRRPTRVRPATPSWTSTPASP